MNLNTAPEPEASVETTVGRRLSGSLLWSLGNNALSRLGSFLAGIVMARILVPEDYGVYAIGLVVLTVLLSMNELGVSLAVVREQGPVDRIVPTVSTLAIASSLVLFLAALAAAPVLAAAVGAPGATGVIRLLAVGVLVDGLTSVPGALMTRSFMQRQRLVIDLVAFVVSTPVAIGLALAGEGAFSLAWGAVVGNLFSAALTLRAAPAHPRPGFDRAVVRELLAFGVPLAATSLLLLAMLNVDYVVVGRVLGPRDLGLYLLAFNLCSWPVVIVSTAVRRVSLAGFARWAEAGPEALQDGFRRVLSLVVAVTLPMCVLLAVYPADLVHVLYGSTWAPAATLLPFLAVLGLARVLVELVYDYAVVLGRGRANLVLHGVWLVALVPVLTAGAVLAGIRGVAIGHCVVVVVVVVPVLTVVLKRAGVSVRALVGVVVPSGLGAAALVLSAVACHLLFAPGPLRLVVGGLVGVTFFVAVVGRRVVADYRELVSG